MGTTALEAHEVETVVDEDPAVAWRVEKYLSLGFSEIDAELLAAATDAAGFPVYWGHVAAQLDRGMSHVIAVAIYA